MEITKEVLQTRIDGMGEQMQHLLARGNRIQASIHQVKGALALCKELVLQLETPEPEELLDSDPEAIPIEKLAELFERADVVGLAEGKACGCEDEDEDEKPTPVEGED